VNRAAYRLSREQLDEQQRLIQELLDKGLIRESGSEWGSPVLFVPKPENKWRMCVDYRALNACSDKDTTPLPRIDDCLRAFGTARYFTKLDLLSGFWQVLVAEEDRHKTAFNTIYGKYEFKVMPFGLTNAPATFQKMMNQILRPYLHKFCVVYLDDIIIYSHTLEKHAEQLSTVLAMLKEYGLYARTSKCSVGKEEVEFCGYILSAGQIRPQRNKVGVITTWPQPRTAHDVRQFLGIANYYRKFVKRFAHITAPLTELLKEADESLRRNKHRVVKWTAACTYAFETVKRLLSESPVLVQPDESRPFTIETDASDFAIGMVLLQEGPDGKLHPVAYEGRKLQAAELHYPVHEKELLAIKQGLRTWDHFVRGKHTTVITDHHSLQYIPSTVTASRRLERWLDEFSQYDLDIRYRPGSQAVIPDALSRRPDWGSGVLSTAVAEDGMTEYELLKKYLTSDDVNPASTGVPLDTLNRLRLTNKGELRYKLHEFPDGSESLLLRNSAPYIDPEYRSSLIITTHREYGHFRWPGILGALESKGWWPSMRADVNRIVSDCKECQLTQREPKGEKERQFHRVRERQPFEEWGIDLIGILPQTHNGNQWIVTAIDYATGWPVAQALPNAEAETVARFIYEKIFIEYGAPVALTSDNGMQFLSRVVAALLRILKTEHKLTTPYHPRTNGKVESLNGTLGTILTKMCVGELITNWDSFLPAALFACRVRMHRTMKYSPFYLVYGQRPRLLGDDTSEDLTATSLDSLLERTKRVQHARTQAIQQLLTKAARLDLIDPARLKAETVPTRFQPNNWVLLRNEAKTKFKTNWLGPYKVLKAHPLGTYALETPDGRVMRHLVHGNRLIRAHCDSATSFWTAQEIADQNNEEASRLAMPHSPEIEAALSTEPKTMRWTTLSTLTKQQWKELERKRREEPHAFEGAREFLVGESSIDRDIARQIFRNDTTKRRRQALSRQPVGASGLDSNALTHPRGRIVNTSPRTEELRNEPAEGSGMIPEQEIDEIESTEVENNRATSPMLVELAGEVPYGNSEADGAFTSQEDPEDLRESQIPMEIDSNPEPNLDTTNSQNSHLVLRSRRGVKEHSDMLSRADATTRGPYGLRSSIRLTKKFRDLE
jgi:transposase InsO family protein